jgi:hypothetical protein
MKMKRFLAIAILMIVGVVSIFAQDTIILQGHYYGKNLYVINPTNSIDNSFCVKKVLVNDSVSKDELRSNSFEVDFSLLNITVGSEVKVLIIHDTACKVKVINAEVLQPRSTFAFVSTKIDKAGKITWIVKGELNSAFTVEQFRWKKWVTLSEVDITDTVKKNVYAFETKPHFGPNQFRISQTDVKGIVVYSKLIKYRNLAIKEITLVSTKVTETITFTAESAYEIFDEKGTFIMDGYGKEVNISDLSKGKYWVNYDNKTEMVTKK